MKRILVAVFDSEKKAYQGKSALRQLEREGSTRTHAGVVVAIKHVDGTVSVKQLDKEVPIGSLTGTAVGGLLGLLGGPVGLAVGALSGLTLGAFYDMDNPRVGGDFVDDVSESLAPETVAIIAEIDEEWTTPVDTLIEALGGVVFRRALSEVREEIHDGVVGAIKAYLAQPRPKANLKRNAAAAGRVLKERAQTWA